MAELSPAPGHEALQTQLGSASRLALVGADHQLYVAQPGGAAPVQVSWPKALDGLGRWGGASAADEASWPCWSPDGRWLACFQVRTHGPSAGTTVAAVETDGVEERILHRFTDRVPIHLQWSPIGGTVAVLMQHTESLELWICQLDGRPARLIAAGSPLFFHWTLDGAALVLHVGDGDDEPSRIELRHLDEDLDDRVFRVAPGSFCTPLVAGQGVGARVVYAIRRGPRTQLVSGGLDGEGLLGLDVVDGLAAVVLDAQGTRVAYSSAPAPGANGIPYQGIRVVDINGGEPRQLVEGPVLAFHWCPTGRRMVWCQWGAERNRLAWFVVDADGGAPRRLAHFWPTRDQLFQLHFFEQFARSHPAISPSGEWLVWAGHEDSPEGKGEVSHRAPLCRVLRLDDPEAVPQVVGPGSYAVFGP